MLKSQTEKMIDFKPISIDDKRIYENYLWGEGVRGCEFSFANLYLWGRQNIAFIQDQIALFSQFNRRSVYPYPLGGQDKKAVIDAIISDAAARGIPCRITGICSDDRCVLEALYPGRFRFHCDEDSFDYVYDISDLADLHGKKYHSKRNHIYRFSEAFPGFKAVTVNEDNIGMIKEMADSWYEKRILENPNADYHMERAALNRAFMHYRELGMDGLAIVHEETVLAFSLGTRLSADTFDVQFEKADGDIQGAYATVNREFARYIRDKYPDIKFLDREEDMGSEGIRKAKRSYHPHHMIEKWWACLLEDGYDY